MARRRRSRQRRRPKPQGTFPLRVLHQRPRAARLASSRVAVTKNRSLLKRRLLAPALRDRRRLRRRLRTIAAQRRVTAPQRGSNPINLASLLLLRARRPATLPAALGRRRLQRLPARRQAELPGATPASLPAPRIPPQGTQGTQGRAAKRLVRSVRVSGPRLPWRARALPLGAGTTPFSQP